MIKYFLFAVDYGNPPGTRSIVTTVLAVIIPAVLVLVVILVTMCLYIKYGGRKKIYPQRMACNAATTLSIQVNERGILRRTRSSHHWTIARTQVQFLVSQLTAQYS